MTKRNADVLNGLSVDAVISPKGVIRGPGGVNNSASGSARIDDEIQVTMLGSGVLP